MKELEVWTMPEKESLKEAAKDRLKRTLGYSESQSPAKQDTVTEDRSVVQSSEISDEYKAALRLEAKVEEIGEGSQCPQCRKGEIAKTQASVEKSQTSGTSQKYSAGLSGTNLEETRSDQASRTVSVSEDVYRCEEGKPKCPLRFDGDKGRIAELKTEGKGPTNTKKYQTVLENQENLSHEQTELSADFNKSM